MDDFAIGQVSNSTRLLTAEGLTAEGLTAEIAETAEGIEKGKRYTPFLTAEIAEAVEFSRVSQRSPRLP